MNSCNQRGVLPLPALWSRRSQLGEPLDTLQLANYGMGSQLALAMSAGLAASTDAAQLK